jgi:hypothetical protein
MGLLKLAVGIGQGHGPCMVLWHIASVQIADELFCNQEENIRLCFRN